MGVVRRNSKAPRGWLTNIAMFQIDEIGRRRQVSELKKNSGVRSQLLTVRQVSEWLNVSPSWVRDHATNRRRPALPCLKLGKSFRFREDQLAEWVGHLSEQEIV